MKTADKTTELSSRKSKFLESETKRKSRLFTSDWTLFQMETVFKQKNGLETILNFEEKSFDLKKLLRFFKERKSLRFSSFHIHSKLFEPNHIHNLFLTISRNALKARVNTKKSIFSCLLS
jgi:hypothetical protein